MNIRLVPRGRSWPGVAYTLLACCFLTGCDPTGEYETRRKNSLQLVARRSEITQFLGPLAAIPDMANQRTGASIAVPKLFGGQAQPGDKAGMPYNANMKYELPGSSGEGPTMYIGSQTLDKVPDFAALQALIEPAVKLLSPQANVESGEFQTESLTGEALPVMLRIQIRGPQQFLIAQPGAPAKANSIPGLTDIYVAKTSTHLVAFVFRATSEGMAQHNLEAIIAACLKSVVIK